MNMNETDEKPFHEYTPDDTYRLAKTKQERCIKLAKEYASKLDPMYFTVQQSAVRTEYGTCKGLTLDRGFYHPGDAMDICVTNVKRGTLYKRKPTGKGKYYRYTFNDNDRLICSEVVEGKYCVNCEIILISKHGNEYGIWYTCDHMSDKWEIAKINGAEYDNGRLICTYKFLPRYLNSSAPYFSMEEMCLYEYDEDGRRSSCAISFYPLARGERVIKYEYLYNDDGTLCGAKDMEYGRITRFENGRFIHK